VEENMKMLNECKEIQVPDLLLQWLPNMDSLSYLCGDLAMIDFVEYAKNLFERELYQSPWYEPTYPCHFRLKKLRIRNTCTSDGFTLDEISPILVMPTLETFIAVGHEDPTYDYGGHMRAQVSHRDS